MILSHRPITLISENLRFKREKRRTPWTNQARSWTETWATTQSKGKRRIWKMMTPFGRAQLLSTETRSIPRLLKALMMQSQSLSSLEISHSFHPWSWITLWEASRLSKAFNLISKIPWTRLSSSKIKNCRLKTGNFLKTKSMLSQAK